MASDSATAVASQQSIKAHVTASSTDGYSPAACIGGESNTFPNGIILKHGYTAIAATTGTITFGTAFPTGVVSLSLSVKNAAASGIVNYTDFTTADIDWIANAAGLTGFSWQAWGY